MARTPTSLPTHHVDRDRIERILWPDGPTCPRCGARERPALREERPARVTFECPRCDDRAWTVRDLSGGERSRPAYDSTPTA